jgi:hypothetical protein
MKEEFDLKGIIEEIGSFLIDCLAALFDIG